MNTLLAECAQAEPASWWEAILLTAFCFGLAVALVYFILRICARR